MATANNRRLSSIGLYVNICICITADNSVWQLIPSTSGLVLTSGFGLLFDFQTYSQETHQEMMTDRSERRRSTLPPASPSNADSNREARGLKFSELHEICATGDSDKLEEMLKSGKFEFVNYKDPDWDGRTPLHWCSIAGKGDMVRRLIDKGAHPGLRSTSGWTAAHFAVEAGKTNVLRVLHNMNSPMDRKDLFGDTPKRIAQIYGHKDTVEFLKIAENEFRERRVQAELSGEAEPHDDEDKEWCSVNNISPEDYVSPEELSALESARSLKREEESARRSKKGIHYGKQKILHETKKPKKSPKTERRRSSDVAKVTDSSKTTKKQVGSPNNPRKSSRRNSSLDRIAEK